MNKNQSKIEPNHPHQVTHENWPKKGHAMVLGLFHAMAQRVPAYKILLQEHDVDPASIKTIHDFETLVPIIDKDNYLRRFSRQELSWDGLYPTGQWNIATTSGSSGKPYYFPRQTKQDAQYARMAEEYLVNNFKINERSTLYIVAFPMGAWIGGVFTYEALQQVARKGYNLSVITPGIHTAEIINAITELSSDFDQVIIGGYAPFTKDIIDAGLNAGINWRAVRVGFVFSAEAFSEVFRDYVMEVVGADNIYTTTLNHYGTVDLGTMAYETPLAVFVRKTLYASNGQEALLPADVRQPTLCQYNPSEFYFEDIDHRLFCSAYAGLPLVRYDLKDYGGLISHETVNEVFLRQGIPLDTALARSIQASIDNRPFVYVYERDDLSIGYYAFRLYPDTIRRQIFASGLHKTVLSGKFSIETIYDKTAAQRLLVHVEMKDGAFSEKTMRPQLVRLFHSALLHESSEYAEIHKSIGTRVKPIVFLHPYGSSQYFRVGSKQKWVIIDSEQSKGGSAN